MGIDVDIFTEEGKSAKDGTRGELIVKKPFPSMPVKFWDDDTGEKYKKAYFNKYKNTGLSERNEPITKITKVA